MIEAIFKAVGHGFVVPVALVLLAGWALKALSDARASSRRTRKEFLEVWKTLDRTDDLVLEAGTRRLIGAYLPAPVIRAALDSGAPSRILFGLASIWDLLEFDLASRQVKPRRAEHGPRGVHMRWYFLAGYVAAALLALGFLHLAIAGSPSSLTTWLFALNALAAGVLAFASLARSEALGVLAKDGPGLVGEVNSRMQSMLPAA